VTTTLQVLLLLLAFGLSAADQKDLGTIYCTVETSQGKPMPFANAELVGTILGSMTDSEGKAKITRVPPGNYQLKISYLGFATEIDSIQVEPGTNEIVVLLAEVQAGPKAREMDMARIRNLVLFAVRPTKAFSVYIDSFRLE